MLWKTKNNYKLKEEKAEKYKQLNNINSKEYDISFLSNMTML